MSENSRPSFFSRFCAQTCFTNIVEPLIKHNMKAPMLILFWVLLVATSAAGAPITSAKNATKPLHLILLVLDDVGWADVGYHGSDFATPNIDALSSSGIELDRMYAMPQCSPTRASLLTGRYAWNMGMQHFTTIFPGTSAGVPTENPMMPEELKKAGYAPHAIGKW